MVRSVTVEDAGLDGPELVNVLVRIYEGDPEWGRNRGAKPGREAKQCAIGF
jgi:hypothetical protein